MFKLANKTFVISQYEDGLTLPTSPLGFVMTRDEWEYVKAIYDGFYKTDEFITINEKTQYDIDNPKEYTYPEPPPKPPKPGHIYFIKALESGHIKIGYTSNLKSRIKSMQTASPFQLELVASYESFGIQEEEALAHEYFKYHRVRGEWFEITYNNIFKFIEEREREING